MRPGSRALAGVLVALFIAVAGFVAFLGREERSGHGLAEPASRPADLAEPRPPELAPLRTEVAGTGAPERRAAEALGGTYVRGHVVLRGSGEPVGGATVTALTGVDEVDFPETAAQIGPPEEVANLWRRWIHRERLEEIGGWKPAHTGATAPDGSFAIPVPHDLASFRFAVDAPGAIYEGDLRFSLAGPEGRVGIVLEVEPAGSVEGTLRDGHGNPVPSGFVLLANGLHLGSSGTRSARGDAEGRFSFRGIRPGTWWIAARGQACAPTYRGGVEVRPGEKTRVDLVLGAESAVLGVVVDERGNGIAGAEVNVHQWSSLAMGSLRPFESRSTRTDAEGRFRIGSLRPGSYNVRAYLPGSSTEDAEANLTVPPGELAHGIRLVVPGGGRSIAGRVVDRTGAPVPGARVAARNFGVVGGPPRPSPLARWIRREATADSDGRFVVRNLDGEAFAIEAASPTGGGTLVEPVTADARDLELVLPGPTGISGTFREEGTGEPVRRFRIEYRRTAVGGVPFDEVIERWEQRWFNAADGGFEMPDLAEGTYRFRFVSDGYLDADLADVEVKAGEMRSGLEVAAHAAQLLRGRVTAKGTGEGVAGALVDRLDVGQGEPVSTRTKEDGRFEIRSPGRPSWWVQLGVRHPDFAPASIKPVTDERQAAKEIVIELSKGGAIEGTVRKPDGAPSGGARIRAESGSDFAKTASEVAAGPDGTFRIERLAPGRYDLHAFLPDPDFAERASWTSADVEEGRVAHVSFTTAPREAGCTLRGRVTRGTEEIAGARVSVLGPSPDRGILRDGSTGTCGQFVLRDVPFGPATLVVDPPHSSWGEIGVAAASFRIEVPRAAEHFLELRMPAGEIRGRVRRKSDGEPLSRVRLALRALDPAPADAWTEVSMTVRTGNDGSFRFVGLARGEYVVDARPEWSGPEAERIVDWPAPGSSGPVRVPAGATVRVDVDLQIGGTAEVQVLDEAGKAERSARVELRADGAMSEGSRGDRGGVDTDGRGIAIVRGLRPGIYSARAERTAGGRAAGESAPLPVESGGKTRFVVTVR